MVKNQIAALEFYKLYSNKEKNIQSKKSVHRATVYRWLKKFESTGSGTGNATDLNDATRRKIKRMVNNKVGVSQRT